MASKATSKRLKKSAKESTLINGIELTKHEPSTIFKNHKEIKKALTEALTEALMEGDKEAFVDILSSYIRVHNILQVCRRTGLSRTVVYEAIGKNGNPSLETLCKIMSSFKKVA